MEKETKLNYDDVTIIPARVSEIKSRKECNPYDSDGFLPIYASCMSSIVSLENVKDYNNSKIRVVLPRTYSLDERVKFMNSQDINFTAFSLKEAEELFIEGRVVQLIPESTDYIVPWKICIDLANGHMKELLDTCKKIKEKWKTNIEIMTGNIANPETYEDYCNSGIDYARFSIGTGNCCSTSSNTGVHYPIFSLLQEAYKIKKKINGRCKIIADGGIRGFRDIQKALIYADSVMIGSLFGSAIESSGKTTYGKRYWNIRGYKILRPITTLLTYGKEIAHEKLEWAWKEIRAKRLSAFKEIWGMSTRKAQQEIAQANGQKSKNKTAEGLMKYRKVEFNLPGWSENETDYLRSAMSYTGSRNLEEYKDSQWERLEQIKYNN